MQQAVRKIFVVLCYLVACYPSTKCCVDTDHCVNPVGSTIFENYHIAFAKMSINVVENRFIYLLYCLRLKNFDMSSE